MMVCNSGLRSCFSELGCGVRGLSHSYFLYCSECSAAHLIRISACPGLTPRLQLRQRQTRFCRFGSCPGARLGNAALCFAPAPASAAPLTWPRLPRSSLCPQGSGSVPGTAGQGNAAKRRLLLAASEPHGDCAAAAGRKRGRASVADVGFGRPRRQPNHPAGQHLFSCPGQLTGRTAVATPWRRTLCRAAGAKKQWPSRK